jgi:hypothetical protein
MSSAESLSIGGLVFEEMDQADFTGPFEVLSRVLDSSFQVIGRTKEPVRDVKGLILTPTLALSEAPQLDVLLVPGGNGVNALMEDEEVSEDGYVFSVPRSSENLDLAATVISLETECCPFFSFSLDAKAGEPVFTFGISASTETRGFLRHIFEMKE